MEHIYSSSGEADNKHENKKVVYFSDSDKSRGIESDQRRNGSKLPGMARKGPLLQITFPGKMTLTWRLVCTSLL